MFGDVHLIAVMEGTTRREEFKLALLPSWDLTGRLSYSRFNRDRFYSYSVTFTPSLATEYGRGLMTGAWWDEGGSLCLVRVRAIPPEVLSPFCNPPYFFLVYWF